MFKVNKKDTKMTSMMLFWYLYFNFEHISHLFLFLLLILNRQMFAGYTANKNGALQFTF